MFLTNFLSEDSFTNAKNFLLDTLFPLSCLGCRAKGAWLCVSCQASIPLRNEQHCPLCFKSITPYGQVCFACQDAKSPALDGILVASYYKHRLLSRAIHTYKYRFLPTLALPLALLLENALMQSALPLPNLLIPVPLHPRRLRFRGFNQSALLAEQLSQALVPGLVLPLTTDCLLRTRYTKPQMKTTSRAERMENLQGAFALAPTASEKITDQNIWLIDDVATTGTTLEECAILLKKHGARSVFGIVLAR